MSIKQENQVLEISDDIQRENIKTLSNLVLEYDRSGNEKVLSDAVALAKELISI